MASSITKIQTITVGSGGAISIDFTNIPQTYTDLKIVYSARDSAAYGTLRVAYNNDGTVGNYAYRQFYREATTVVGDSQNELFFGNVAKNTYTASTFGTGDVYIANYASSSLSKPTLGDAASQTNGTTAIVGNFLGNYAPTTAITRVTLSLFSGSNFTEFSSATLYGITAYVEAGTGSKATGGTVTTASGYTYHTFFSSGMFTPTASITGAEVLVVAGGGGTSGSVDGGGGAGGLVYASSQSFTSGTGYSAIVGAGGAGGVPGVQKGNNGTNSVFAAGTVAIGGGSGNGSLGSNSGGSGGGQGAPGSSSVGSGTSGQGNNGGATGGAYGGGGGGAGAAGGTGGTGSRGGDGGVGLSTYSAWGAATGTGENVGGTYYYAGGGGGGAWNGVAANGIGGQGGLGGGGQGGGSNTTLPIPYGTNGMAFTGGGAGGDNGYVFSGGSGIIIIRYTT
jgi:hypothetical protein